MKPALLSLLLFMSHKPLVPAGGAKPVGPYVPGLDAGDYVYVSGQGASDSEGRRATDIESQTRQAISNVRVILEAAGLGLADVQAVQFYLLDLANLAAADRIYHEAFGNPGPPRVILGTARMPTDTPVEITVVAKKKSAPPNRRVYLPAVYGKDAADASAQFDQLLASKGLKGTDVLQKVDYLVAPWRAGFVSIDALPGGAKHAIFAMAALGEGRNEFSFCMVKSSDPASGGVEEQTRDVFVKLKDCLGRGGYTLADITATNVYLNNMDDFAKMNAVYASFFPDAKPTRTTVQPAPTVTGSEASLVRISAFAVK